MRESRNRVNRVSGHAVVFSSIFKWFYFFQGTLLLDDGRPVKLEYSRYDSLDGRSSSLSGSGDWMCAKVYFYMIRIVISYCLIFSTKI